MPKLLIPFETKNREKTPADLRPRVTVLWPMSQPLYPLVFVLAGGRRFAGLYLPAPQSSSSSGLAITKILRVGTIQPLI